MRPETLTEKIERVDSRQLARRASIGDSLYERDGRRCFACRFHCPQILNRHHIKPVSKGGPARLSNLVLLCPNCHALVHWCAKRFMWTLRERRDGLTDRGLVKSVAFKIALIFSEDVAVDPDGTLWPLTRLHPDETITHVELYDIFNWQPEPQNVGD